MKVSALKTRWIIFVSALYTINTCGRSIIMRAIGKTSRAWVNKTLLLWSHRILNLVRVSYKVVNKHGVEPIPGKATMVMCNHSSLYDIPLSLQAFPKHAIRMLSKKELAKIPIMGKGMTAAEFPFIDRSNRTQAIKDLAWVRQLMESGIVMWVFPEGTRSKDGKLAAFKRGAFTTAIEAHATIIPVGIRGAFDILPARTKQSNLNQQSEIHIGDPIDASEYTLDDKDALIKRVHGVIEVLVGEQV